MSARRTLIDRVFPALRRRGVYARANFLCCGGCGHCKASETALEHGLVGYVFWHKQDEARFTDGRAGVHIKFGAVSDVTTSEIGEMLAEEAVHAGLNVSWNGDPTTCVWIE